MYSLIIEKKAKKFIQKHKWSPFIKTLSEKLTLICEDPERNDLDIKPLIWYVWKYRLRIWQYRFLYEVNDSTITVTLFDAWARGGIYKSSN